LDLSKGFKFIDDIDNNKFFTFSFLDPPNLPIIGHALMCVGLSPEAAFTVALKHYKRYGSVISGYFGTRVIIVLLDPKDIKIILGSSVHLDKSVEYR